MIVAAVMFPVMVGMIAIAEDMFTLLLTDRWAATVPYFKILSLAGLFYPLSMIAYNILKVSGDGKVILRLEIIKKGIMTIILALTIPHSVIAIAWGLVAMAVVEFILNIAASLRTATLTPWQVVRALLPTALLCCVMYIAVRWCAIEMADCNLTIRFFVQIATGVAVYTLGAIIFRLDAAKEIVETLRRMVRR